jgi:hypothetical protein
MISFRLTADEYERLRRLCLNNGIHNMSEVARFALDNMLLQQSIHSRQDALESRVADLEGRINVLTLEVRRLT